MLLAARGLQARCPPMTSSRHFAAMQNLFGVGHGGHRLQFPIQLDF
jgi:hypothetical protein